MLHMDLYRCECLLYVYQKLILNILRVFCKTFKKSVIGHNSCISQKITFTYSTEVSYRCWRNETDIANLGYFYFGYIVIKSVTNASLILKNKVYLHPEPLEQHMLKKCISSLNIFRTKADSRLYFSTDNVQIVVTTSLKFLINNFRG